jgi:hypothetical protein
MLIATWNLMRPPDSGSRREALLARVATINADVWVLTETRRGFAPGAEYALASVSAPAPDRHRDESWVSIWSRLPSSPLALNAEPERTACAQIRVGDTALLVYGSVLPWISDSRRHVRGADAFAIALRAQAEEWLTLRSALPGTELIIAGDLNQDLAAFHYYGSRRGKTLLAESVAAAGLVCLTASSSDPLLRHAGRASIDHICVTEALAVSATVFAWPTPEEVGKKLTDHFGVAAHLTAV